MEQKLSEKLFQALVQLQGNKIYIGRHENEMNDGLRDMLNMVFECADQTRQGISESEIDTGEVDILIKQNGIPVSVIESLRINYLAKDLIKRHKNKVLTKYDFNGCKIVNVVIYAIMTDFDAFWKKCCKYLEEECEYPYKVLKGFEDCDTCLAESRHGKVLLEREGVAVSLHIYSIHMRE